MRVKLAKDLKAGDVILNRSGERVFRVTDITRELGYVLLSGTYERPRLDIVPLKLRPHQLVTVDGAHDMKRSTMSQSQIAVVLCALGRGASVTDTDVRRVQRFFRSGETSHVYDRLDAWTRDLVDAVTRVVRER